MGPINSNSNLGGDLRKKRNATMVHYHQPNGGGALAGGPSKHMLKTMHNNASSSRHVMIFDDGKQSFSKIETGSLSPHKMSQNYFQSQPSTMRIKDEARKGKRFLYTGVHEIPVFNLRISNQPILIL